MDTRSVDNKLQIGDSVITWNGREGRITGYNMKHTEDVFNVRYDKKHGDSYGCSYNYKSLKKLDMFKIGDVVICTSLYPFAKNVRGVIVEDKDKPLYYVKLDDRDGKWPMLPSEMKKETKPMNTSVKDFEVGRVYTEDSIYRGKREFTVIGIPEIDRYGDWACKVRYSDGGITSIIDHSGYTFTLKDNDMENKVTVKFSDGSELTGTMAQVERYARYAGVTFNRNGYYKSESRGWVKISDMDNTHLRNAVNKLFRKFTDSIKDMQGSDLVNAYRNGCTDPVFKELLAEYTRRVNNGRI